MVKRVSYRRRDSLNTLIMLTKKGNLIFTCFHLLSCIHLLAKGLVAELAHSQAQSAWESRDERVQTVGLAAYYNYLKKNCIHLPSYEGLSL